MSNAYWSEEFLRPAFANDAVWQKILSNFLSHIGGDPAANLPVALQSDLDRLISLGISSPTALAALKFEIEQAGDFGTLAERGSMGAMGQGWSSLADIKLLIAADGSKIVTGLANADALKALDATRTAQYAVSLPLGKIIGQDGRFVGSAFVRPVFEPLQTTYKDMTLAPITGGYELKTGAGDMFVFGADGKLTSFVSGTGEEITVIYDVNDRISRYENAEGKYIEFTYDGNGKVASVEDHNGRVSGFTYDGNGLLGDVGDDAGDTEFTYDGEGNLLTTQRVGGPEVTFTYDAEGRLSAQDVGGLVAESYSYDTAGAITLANGLSEETVLQIGPGGYIAGVENNLGQSLSVTADPATRTVTIEDANNVESILAYDSAGRLQSFTNGNNNTISFSYNAEGRLSAFSDAGGGNRDFSYDGSGRLLTSTWDTTMDDFMACHSGIFMHDFKPIRKFRVIS